MTEPKLHWEDPDWLKQVSDWIEAETSHQNIKITGPIEQTHIYPWSTVLRVPTNEGTLFFKATAQETLYEAALTQALAGWYPHCMPEFMAVDAGRGWMLMRDGGEPLRASIRPTKDIAPWIPVISLFSKIQFDSVEHVSELLALGIPDWRLKNLPDLYSLLLKDTEILRVDQPDGLASEDFQHVQELVPRFTQICDQLATFGIPETVNHGDFHDGNVLIKNGHITLFDWGDGCVAHPFISLRTFFVSIEIALNLEDFSFTPEMAALLDLYLEPWRQFASKENLLAAYKTSRCVASIVKALMWHQIVSNLEQPFREKYNGIVPELMREFLAYEKMLQI